MSALVDLLHQRFGQLTVIRFAGLDRHNKAVWECVCDCGRTRVTRSGELRKGKSVSCGCWRKVVPRKHGLAHTSEYRIWKKLKTRCLSPSSKDFKDYGKRGIDVCKRWLSFENFYSDMGPRPSPIHSIERRDNNAGYSPTNCYWATPTEQANNKRNTVYVEFRGRRMGLAEACRIANASYSTVYQRLRAGKDAETALGGF